jgi:hypothetical protein
MDEQSSRDAKSRMTEPDVRAALNAEPAGDGAQTSLQAPAEGAIDPRTLDLGAILGGITGGASGNMPGGMGAGPLDGLIGPLVDGLAKRTGLPREIVMMGAMFLISKMFSGGMQQGGQPIDPFGGQSGFPPDAAGGMGGLDLGSILGGLLGGGAGPGFPPQGGAEYPPSGGMPGGIDLGSILGGMMGQDPMGGPPPSAPSEDPSGPSQAPAGQGEVLGKIGRKIDETPASGAPAGGIRINGLTAGELHGSDMVNEFAQYAGLDEETAERSLAELMRAIGAA